MLLGEKQKTLLPRFGVSLLKPKTPQIQGKVCFHRRMNQYTEKATLPRPMCTGPLKIKAAQEELRNFHPVLTTSPTSSNKKQHCTAGRKARAQREMPSL